MLCVLFVMNFFFLSFLVCLIKSRLHIADNLCSNINKHIVLNYSLERSEITNAFCACCCIIFLHHIVTKADRCFCMHFAFINHHIYIQFTANPIPQGTHSRLRLRFSQYVLAIMHYTFITICIYQLPNYS